MDLTKIAPFSCAATVVRSPSLTNHGSTPYEDHPCAEAEWKWHKQAQDEILGESGDNWTRYRKAHLWARGDKAEDRAGYQLPIACMVEGTLTVVSGAIVAAVKALNSAKGVEMTASDRKACYAHAKKYAAKAGIEIAPLKGYDAPEAKAAGTGDGPKTRRTWKFVASAAVEDRVDDIIEQDWVLGPYKSNPVILWNHDPSIPPPGRSVSVDVVEGQLVINVEYDLEDPLGEMIDHKVDGGFINTVSVGFKPGAMQPRYMLADGDPRKSDSGYIMSNNELLEISNVSVPALREALAQRGLLQGSAEPESALLPAVRAMIARSIEADLTLDARIARAVEVAMGAALPDAIAAAVADLDLDLDEDEEDFWADDDASPGRDSGALWPDDDNESEGDFWSD